MPRRISLLALCLLALPALAGAQRSPEAAAKISPDLRAALADAPDGRAEMLVVLAEQADLAPARRLPTKLEKGRFVFSALRATAERTQASLLAELDRRGVEHRVFWIANFVWTRGELALAEALAGRGDVARIEANPRMTYSAPIDEGFGTVPGELEIPLTIEWNITWVNADDVWALGYAGQGVVVGGQDTGYDWDHPAIVDMYRGWNGASADHDYNWHDAIHSGGGSCGANSPFPCDDYGHGTHTMGTMVGDDGGANQVGMAPGARWIGCRNMDVGDGTPTTYSECFQWFVAPTTVAGTNPDPAMAPDVINNSWSCPPSEGCTTPDILLTVVENTRAAGILIAVSAGNSGSSCESINTPAAIYDASFTVGATGFQTDAMASYSSRGPVTVDGSNRMKPDISAPGSSVRSSVPGGGYSSSSGTSMAGPHVAGLVALVLSAKPALAGDVDAIEQVIRDSAFQPSFGGACGVGPGVFPNNTYGAGRIDALAAVQLALARLPFVDGFESGDTTAWSSSTP